MDTTTVSTLSVAYAAPFRTADEPLEAVCAREIARLERMNSAHVAGLAAFADLPPAVDEGEAF